jgi:hypothetical protein
MALEKKKTGRDKHPENQAEAPSARQATPGRELRLLLDKHTALEKELLIKNYALESAAVGICITDLEGCLTYLNRKALEMGGYEVSEVLGQPFSVFLDGDEASAEKILGALDAEGTWQGELRIKKKSGLNYHAMVWANRVKDEDGKPVCLMASVADISARKHLEEHSAEQAGLLRTVMENTGTKLVYLDRDFNFVMANRAYVDACGYTWEEIKGKNHFTLFPDAENEAIFRRARTSGYVISFVDKPFEFPDQPERGTTYWDWTLVPVKDEAARVTGLVFSLNETTERKQAEAKLEYLASFPELNPNPVLELDNCGKIKYQNPATKQLFPELLAEGAAHPFLAGWGNIVSTLKSGCMPYVARDIKIGESWYEQTITCPPGNENCRLYAIDISDRKKVEQLKDDFIGLVSHELRTPLTVFMGAVQVAKSTGLTAAEVQELLAEAEHSAESLAQILDNLIELSRYEANRLNLSVKPLDIAEVIKEVIDKEKPRLRSRAFVYDIPVGLPKIEADQMRVQQIIHNLVDNAAKYSPEESVIRISAGKYDEEFLRVGVSDRGRGIDESDREKLFQPFQRLEGLGKETKGLGLGLLVCKRLVEAHGGKIWVESTPGRGSTFWFTLRQYRT